MKATQIPIARPTARLNEIIYFYKYALGLKEIGSFQDHNGYDGIMFGLHDTLIHLEFTQH